jgi:hypothetical protein
LKSSLCIILSGFLLCIYFKWVSGMYHVVISCFKYISFKFVCFNFCSDVIRWIKPLLMWLD